MKLKQYTRTVLATRDKMKVLGIKRQERRLNGLLVLQGSTDIRGVQLSGKEQAQQ